MQSAETRFGRYVLDRRIAMGGMAELFLAHIEGPGGFHKKVVVKRILPHLQSDDDYVRMFLDEARLAARFDHPNLIQVYELARIENQYCLAMEYIEGEDVAAILDECLRLRRRIPYEIAASIVANAAEGLHYAHELTTEDGAPLNVVHRDISPANIIVTRRGGVKLVDFGIAKHEISQTQTMAGTIKGKFSYMSPEQARGDTVDRRSDIFALGTILFEMCSVSPCFSGKNQIEILNNVIHVRHRPIRELCPDLPSGAEDMLNQMMEAKREDRFATAEDVELAIKNVFLRQQRVSPADIGRFLNELFGRTSKNLRRVATAIHAIDEILVTEEFSSPNIRADISAQRKLLQTREDLSAQLNFGEEPSFEERSGLLARPSLEFDKSSPNLWSVAEWRFWPKMAAVLGAVLLLGILVIISLYRASTGDEISATDSMNLPAVTEEVPAGTAPVVAEPVVTPILNDDGRVELEVVTEPAGAIVILDGTETNKKTPATLRVEPGAEIEISAKLIGFHAKGIALTPSASAQNLIRIPLIEARAGDTGILDLDCDPRSEVYVDDKKIGTTPLKKISLPAGPVVVQIRNSRYGLSKTLRLDIPPGDTVRRRVIFKKGYVAFDVRPWADVYLGKKKLGTTPMPPITLFEGSFTFRLVNPELNVERTVQVVVKAGKTKKVMEKLR